MPVTQADRENGARPYSESKVDCYARHIAAEIRAGRCDEAASVLAAMYSREAALDEAAGVATSIGQQYGEDETGWFECSETIARQITTLKANPHD